MVLCGNVGQKKTNIFIYLKWVGGGEDKKQKVVISIYLWEYPHFFPSHLPFHKRGDSLVVTAWNLS